MDGNDARRTDRLEAMLRAAHARRGAPPVDAGLADSVLAAIKAGPGTAKPCATEPADARIDRLERVLRTAQGRRLPPPLDPAMAVSVLEAIKAEAAAQPDQETSVLWSMAAGAGLLAAATVLFALTFGSGLEGELSRLLFYDPSGQVLVSLLGV
ncbi:hypothetical protein GTA51_08695 [Desulfovibrio aerotolerans]|uniref:Uncharacterized protein n=1 Tax=Solidesulfovibrio aerotolerans TaxID=295255 RepID=A0A7C9MJ68_9BACT|nr:hypothetical protein [Solidesulfovibrio aerotolerans]MYL83209.1 hypothetical protein [Solidesulfovibrio aerotolerans]